MTDTKKTAIPAIKVRASAEQELGVLDTMVKALESMEDTEARHRVLWYLWDRAGRPSMSTY